jgi:hypothetical protein
MTLLNARRGTDVRVSENARVCDLSFSSSPIPPARPASSKSATYGRAEPHLDDGPEQQRRERAAQEWVRYAALHEQPRLLKPRRRWPGIAWMLGIFTFGAAVGLGVAWWLTTPSPLQTTPAKLASVPATVHAPDLTPGGKGITQSELPYDGWPPPEQNASALALKPANSEEVPRSTVKMAAEPAKTIPAADSGRSEASESTSEAAPRKQATATQAPSERKATPAEPVQAKAVVATKPAERKVSARHTPARRAKDREIERIKQQAAEELKKKSKTWHGGSEARLKRSKSESHGTAFTRSMLARCNSAPNVISREQCKWRLCSGKWGKGGCPSYQTQVSSL